MNPKKSGEASGRTLVFGICVFLAAIVWVVFGQTLGHGFINYDDDKYVYENQEVLNGLSLRGAARAFTHTVSSNWHPLTMLSYMLDGQIYGRNPGGYHLTNVQLHTVAVILLFLVLENMTGAIWRSAFVAALFAIHPLHVESVAWVSERKDVLSGVFFMLTLGAYVRYVRSPRSPGRYLLVVFLFALGLMAKPMLVTLPFILLLLDYWPLGRMDLGFGKLILEKVPLLALSIAASGAALLTQRKVIAPFPLSSRISNALVSSAAYIGQSIYPAGLTVLYPYPMKGSPLWEVIFALLLLAGISGWAFAWRRKHPYVLIGWLWYLGMLVPVVGLVHVGAQARADRYTYLPQIGLALLATWTVADLSAPWRHRRVLLGSAASLLLAALAVCAHAQTSYWRDSETLWNHTLAHTRNNDIAQYNLGNDLLRQGRFEEAVAHYRTALAINPNYAVNHYNLGNTLLRTGQVDDAISHFQRALQIQPDYPEAEMDLGSALRAKGELEAAIVDFQKALALRPDYAEAHYNLGTALLKKGEVGAAIFHFETAIALDAHFFQAQNILAWVLATSSNASLRDGTKAVELATQANQLSGGNNANILRTLAAACAERGQFPGAMAAVRQALQLAAAQGNAALATELRNEMALYEAGSPLHIAPGR